MVWSMRCYKCFEAFFDWPICKILSSDWSVKCHKAFVAFDRPIRRKNFTNWPIKECFSLWPHPESVRFPFPRSPLFSFILALLVPFSFLTGRVSLTFFLISNKVRFPYLIPPVLHGKKGWVAATRICVGQLNVCNLQMKFVYHRLHRCLLLQLIFFYLFSRVSNIPLS